MNYSQAFHMMQVNVMHAYRLLCLYYTSVISVPHFWLYFGAWLLTRGPLLSVLRHNVGTQANPSLPSSDIIHETGSR